MSQSKAMEMNSIVYLLPMHYSSHHPFDSMVEEVATHYVYPTILVINLRCHVRILPINLSMELSMELHVALSIKLIDTPLSAIHECTTDQQCNQQIRSYQIIDR